MLLIAAQVTPGLSWILPDARLGHRPVRARKAWAQHMTCLMVKVSFRGTGLMLRLNTFAGADADINAIITETGSCFTKGANRVGEFHVLLV